MSQELSTEISPEIINSLILTGDMSKLTPGQQTQYYGAVCKSLNLNPLTQPFAIIVLQGKKTLYALKGCAQQLSSNNKISTEILSQKNEDGLYVVNSRAKMPDGRFTDEIGVVYIKGIQGDDLANKMMKAVTKAKRRAVLALCGLGMPDESEVEDFNPAPQADTSKSKVEKIVNQVEEAQVTKAEVKEDVKSVHSEDKKTSKKENVKETAKANEEVHPVDAEPASGSLPEGHHQIQGVITEWKGTEFDDKDDPNKKISKWIFTMGDFKLGTFDADLSGEIIKVLDLQKSMQKGQENLEYKEKSWIMLNFVYKIRITGDKKFKDIVSFSQVTSKQVLI